MSKMIYKKGEGCIETTKKKLIPRDAGFTLVELLIALVLSVVIIGAVYYSFNTQQKSFSLINQKVSMRQQGRAAIDFMMRDIRMAGSRVPKSKAMVITDSTQGPDQVSVLFASSEKDFISGFIITSSTNGSSDSVTVVTQDGSGFAPNNAYYKKNIILMKRDGSCSVIRKIQNYGVSGSGAYRIFQLTSSPASSIFGDSQADLSANYKNQYAYIVSTNTYSVSSHTLYLNENNGGPKVPLSENVDDLQIAYVDRKGTWYCTGSNSASPPSIPDLSAVRITLLVRTAIPDPDFMGQRPAIEDHAAAKKTDHYRRRLLRSYVKIRNLGY